VNDFMSAVVPWMHPATGLLTVMLTARAASLAFGGRRGGSRAGAKLAQHAALGEWVWWLVAGNWALGLATVWVYRPDLDPAASTHFVAGSAMLVLLTVSRLLSRRMHADPTARAVHPWVGLAALVVAGVQVFLGLQLTRW
jgi:hypothetical protein